MRAAAQLTLAAIMLCLPAPALAQIIHCEPEAAQEAEVADAFASLAPRPRIHDLTLLSTSPFGGVLDELVGDGYENLEASFAIDKERATVSWAPWLGGTGDLSETRLSLAHKDGRTTFGLSLKSNPMAPQSGRGIRLWNRGDESFNADWSAINGQRETVEQRLYEVRRDACADAEVRRLRTARAAVQKELEALRAPREGESAAERAARAGAEHGAKLEEWGEVNAALSAAMRKWEGEAAALVAERDRLRTAMTKRFQKRLLGYAEALADTGAPVVGVTGSVTLFSNLFGTDLDADEDGVIDNAHTVARWAVAIDATWRPSPASQLSASLGTYKERASAKATDDLETHWSWGATVARRIATLDPDFRSSEAYADSLFHPGVALGFGVVDVHCRGRERCKDMIERRTTYTPFLDFKIKKEIQFRIGLPLERTRRFLGEDASGLGLVTNVAFQLGV